MSNAILLTLLDTSICTRLPSGLEARVRQTPALSVWVGEPGFLLSGCPTGLKLQEPGAWQLNLSSDAALSMLTMGLFKRAAINACHEEPTPHCQPRQPQAVSSKAEMWSARLRCVLPRARHSRRQAVALCTAITAIGHLLDRWHNGAL